MAGLQVDMVVGGWRVGRGVGGESGKGCGGGEEWEGGGGGGLGVTDGLETDGGRWRDGSDWRVL